MNNKDILLAYLMGCDTSSLDVINNSGLVAYDYLAYESPNNISLDSFLDYLKRRANFAIQYAWAKNRNNILNDLDDVNSSNDDIVLRHFYKQEITNALKQDDEITIFRKPICASIAHYEYLNKFGLLDEAIRLLGMPIKERDEIHAR